MHVAVTGELGEWFHGPRPHGGMFLWMTAHDPSMDTDALYQVALQEGVAFVPSSVFDPQRGLRTSMRLNFTRNDPAVMAEGVARLRRAIERSLAERAA
jgi:2-aminoadipate transaminase